MSNLSPAPDVEWNELFVLDEALPPSEGDWKTLEPYFQTKSDLKALSLLLSQKDRTGAVGVLRFPLVRQKIAQHLIPFGLREQMKGCHGLADSFGLAKCGWPLSEEEYHVPMTAWEGLEPTKDGRITRLKISDYFQSGAYILECARVLLHEFCCLR